MESLWVPRDKDGGLYLYYNKPERLDTYFSDTEEEYDPLFITDASDYYPEVTWKSGPKPLVVKRK